MDELPQASASATVQRPSNADIGMSPLLLSTLMFLGICPGLALLGLLVGSSGPTGAVVAVLAMFPWAIVSIHWGFALLGTILTGGGISYGLTKAAIESGEIGVSYCLRDFRGSNFIIVDESKRLICLNGDVLSFDLVKSVAWETGKQHQLEFTLQAGAHPLRKVDLGTEDALKVAFARLSNSLGLT